MVTRKLKYCKLHVLCYDSLADKPENINIEMTGNFPNADDKRLEREARKIVESVQGYKLIRILSIENEERLFGMPELDFLKSAKELDRKTRKLLTK